MRKTGLKVKIKYRRAAEEALFVLRRALARKNFASIQDSIKSEIVRLEQALDSPEKLDAIYGKK